MNGLTPYTFIGEARKVSSPATKVAAPDAIFSHITDAIGPQPSADDPAKKWKEYAEKKREAIYFQALREITVSDVADGFGFETEAHMLGNLHKAVSEALDALLTQGVAGLALSPRRFDDDRLDPLRSFASKHGHETIIRAIIFGETTERFLIDHLNFEMRGELLLTAFKRMLSSFPNLTFIGGGDFGSVLEFTLGDVRPALTKLHEKPPYKVRRFLPVIETIGVADLVTGFDRGVFDVRGEVDAPAYEHFIVTAPAPNAFEKRWTLGVRTFKPPSTADAQTTLLEVLPEKIVN